jgi:hypothetical protein
MIVVVGRVDWSDFGVKKAQFRVKKYKVALILTKILGRKLFSNFISSNLQNCWREKNPISI